MHHSAPEQAPEALTPIADGVPRMLDPRVIPHRRTVGRIVTACLSLGLLALLLPVLLLVSLPGWITALSLSLWAGFTLTLGLFFHRWPPIAYRHASYLLNQEGIEVRRGVLWRRVIKVPRSRVQHTEVSQGPLERRHGLGRLGVYTAGTAYARVALPGLEHSLALRIREHLQPGGGPDAV